MFNFGDVARIRAECTPEERREYAFDFYEDETRLEKLQGMWFWLYGPSYLIDFYRGARSYVRNPVGEFRAARNWAARPKKAGDKVYYHEEGPYEVLFIDPNNPDELTIDIDGNEAKVSYEACCEPYRG